MPSRETHVSSVVGSPVGAGECHRDRYAFGRRPVDMLSIMDTKPVRRSTTHAVLARHSVVRSYRRHGPVDRTATPDRGRRPGGGRPIPPQRTPGVLSRDTVTTHGELRTGPARTISENAGAKRVDQAGAGHGAGRTPAGGTAGAHPAAGHRPAGPGRQATQGHATRPPHRPRSDQPRNAPTGCPADRSPWAIAGPAERGARRVPLAPAAAPGCPTSTVHSRHS